MTSLRQYLAAEEPDYTEEASFYVAGAHGWNDPNLKKLRMREMRGLLGERLYPTPEALEFKDE